MHRLVKKADVYSQRPIICIYGVSPAHVNFDLLRLHKLQQCEWVIGPVIRRLLDAHNHRKTARKEEQIMTTHRGDLMQQVRLR